MIKCGNFSPEVFCYLLVDSLEVAVHGFAEVLPQDGHHGLKREKGMSLVPL